LDEAFYPHPTRRAAVAHRIVILGASYDGHASCCIETGNHKALLIDFDYETEPVSGRSPMGVGLPLHEESRPARSAA